VAAVARRAAVPGLRRGLPALPDPRRGRGCLRRRRGRHPDARNVRAASGGPVPRRVRAQPAAVGDHRRHGAVFGALLAWAVVTRPRRACSAGSSRPRPGCWRSSAA
jgi:hypothetical protein